MPYASYRTFPTIRFDYFLRNDLDFQEIIPDDLTEQEKVSDVKITSLKLKEGWLLVNGKLMKGE